MFSHKHYVPFLKAKQGELDAIEELDDPVKAQLTPVIEVPAIPWDFKNRRPKTTIDEHLDSIGRKLRKAWDSKAHLFMDVGLIDPALRMKNGDRPLSYVLRKARTQNLRLVPVTGLSRDPEYQKVISAAVADDKWGTCFRLELADFDNANLKTELDNLLSDLNVGRKDTDIILDFGTILPKQKAMLVNATRKEIGTLPYLSEWRTLTVAATAFPATLSGVVDTSSSDFLDRTEWDAWLQLISRSQEPLPRLPAFGDYAIQNPDLEEIDPRMMHPAASIRYTADDKWLIVRGRSTQKYGTVQYRTLCADLMKRKQYGGEKHCRGDAYIKQCASGMGTKGAGSLAIWRRVGTVHHLTKATEMIAKLP
jgi:T4 beta protein